MPEACIKNSECCSTNGKCNQRQQCIGFALYRDTKQVTNATIPTLPISCYFLIKFSRLFIIPFCHLNIGICTSTRKGSHK